MYVDLWEANVDTMFLLWLVEVLSLCLGRNVVVRYVVHVFVIYVGE